MKLREISVQLSETVIIVFGFALLSNSIQ